MGNNLKLNPNILLHLSFHKNLPIEAKQTNLLRKICFGPPSPSLALTQQQSKVYF